MYLNILYYEIMIVNMKVNIQLATFSEIYESLRKRLKRGRERGGGGGRAGEERKRERFVIAVPLCGQIKFKRMTRTLVSRMEQWPFEHTSLEDLSRRLLTLRCTVDGTMENCAATVATAAK